MAKNNSVGLEEMMMQRNASGTYKKLKKAKVGIAGLGGLGSNIAFCLARAGVGFLHLVDFDIVEPSNLNRQQYRVCHLGMKKADALKQEIAEINPFVTVTAKVQKVTPENAVLLFENDDIVCEAFDDPAAKAMLVNKLLAECPSKPLIAASGMAGYSSGNAIKTKRFSDYFYLCGDQESEFTSKIGIMSPRVTICAGHQANMVLRLILGETNE